MSRFAWIFSTGRFLKEAFLLFCGLCLISFFLILFTLSLPIFLFRIVVIYIPKTFKGPLIGEPLSPFVHLPAADFFTKKPPKASWTATILLEGTLSLEYIKKRVAQKWIVSKDPKNTAVLKYPQFQQYIEPWLGFLFWKQDPNFNLKNHLILHQIPDDTKNYTKFVAQLEETLLNERFPSKKSPWELHVVQNYKNPEYGQGVKSLIVLKIHHAMVDGYSMTCAIKELEDDMDDEKLSSIPGLDFNQEKVSFLKKILNFVPCAIQTVYDSLHAFALFFRPFTPWHCPEGKKQWHLINSKSKQIPIARIKQIKSQLGSSFTAVLISSISAGLSKSFTKELKGVDAIQTMWPIPRPNHPRRLTNHFAIAFLHFQVQQDLTPTQRLKACDEMIHQSKNSLLPYLLVQLLNMFGRYFARMSFFLLSAVELSAPPTIFSSFPLASLLDVQNICGKEVLWADGTLANMFTNVGIAFVVLSMKDSISIKVTAETGLMTNSELDSLVGFICGEIDALQRVCNAQEKLNAVEYM